VSDPYVRLLGQVEDADGYLLAIGVDGGTVTVGHPAGSEGSAWRLTCAQAEEFARLFVAASWQADVNRRMAGEVP
jgi:hypothetical protein